MNIFSIIILVVFAAIVVIGIINTIRGTRSAYNRHQTGKMLFYIGCLVLIATAIIACVVAASSPEVAATQIAGEPTDLISDFPRNHPIYSAIFGIMLCNMLFYAVKGAIVGDHKLARNSLILVAVTITVICIIIYLTQII